MTRANRNMEPNDVWVTLEDGEGLTRGAATLIPFTRWSELRAAALVHTAPIGVRVMTGDDVAVLVADLSAFDLIDIHFLTFKDGRGFSLARLLRDRHGYTGQLRASGHVIRDQFLFLHRCGFDGAVLDARNTSDDWSAALDEFSVWYQSASDGRQTAIAARHHSRPALAAAE